MFARKQGPPVPPRPNVIANKTQRDSSPVSTLNGRTVIYKSPSIDVLNHPPSYINTGEIKNITNDTIYGSIKSLNNNNSNIQQTQQYSQITCSLNSNIIKSDESDKHKNFSTKKVMTNIVMNTPDNNNHISDKNIINRTETNIIANQNTRSGNVEIKSRKSPVPRPRQQMTSITTSSPIHMTNISPPSSPNSTIVIKNNASNHQNIIEITSNYNSNVLSTSDNENNEIKNLTENKTSLNMQKKLQNDDDVVIINSFMSSSTSSLRAAKASQPPPLPPLSTLPKMKPTTLSPQSESIEFQNNAKTVSFDSCQNTTTFTSTTTNTPTMITTTNTNPRIKSSDNKKNLRTEIIIKSNSYDNLCEAKNIDMFNIYSSTQHRPEPEGGEIMKTYDENFPTEKKIAFHELLISELAAMRTNNNNINSNNSSNLHYSDIINNNDNDDDNVDNKKNLYNFNNHDAMMMTKRHKTLSQMMDDDLIIQKMATAATTSSSSPTGTQQRSRIRTSDWIEVGDNGKEVVLSSCQISLEDSGMEDEEKIDDASSGVGDSWDSVKDSEER